MSEIPVFCATKEEWFAFNAKLLEEYPEKNRKKTLTKIEEYIDAYDLPINWEKWVEWSTRNLDRSFLFSKRPTHDEDTACIYILNVQEMAWTLQKHYSVISRELKIEFDPLEVVLEFDDLNSTFWEKVFNSHYVQGILHGYGERNAYFFNRKMHLQDTNTFDLLTHPLFKSALDLEKTKKNDFVLPRFRSFFPHFTEDPVYQKYEGEREQIRQLLKGKNTFDLILNRLGYNPDSQKPEISFNRDSLDNDSHPL